MRDTADIPWIQVIKSKLFNRSLYWKNECLWYTLEDNVNWIWLRKEVVAVKTDIEIAQSITLEPIDQIAEKIDIDADGKITGLF